MLHGVFELTLIPVPLLVDQNPIALWLVLFPLSHISLSSNSLPEAFTMLRTVNPFPFIHFPLTIRKLSPSMWLVTNIEPMIDRPISKPLKPQPALLVIQPFPFVNSLIFPISLMKQIIHKHPSAMLDLDLDSFLILHCSNFPKVVPFLVLLDSDSLLVLMAQFPDNHLVKVKRFVFPKVLEHFLQFLLFDRSVLFR
jgi:hypothetical protein